MRERKITENTAFEILPANDGIKLIEVREAGMTLRVSKVMSYKPFAFGEQNPGTAQIGVYRLMSRDGRMFYAMIRDYRACEGDWRIVLVGELAESFDDLKGQVMPN